MNVLELQRALQACGQHPGPLDGLYGPRTRKAVDRALASTDVSPLTATHFAAAGARLGCDAAAVQAVAAVESGPLGAFDHRTRRPIILFEPHVFSRETEGDFDVTHSWISYPQWGERAYPRTQAERWSQLHAALALDPGAALRSASWGLFQIMGFNHRACGFDRPWPFVRAMAESAEAQLGAVVTFIVKRGLDDELQHRRWAGFAYGYNGPGYAKYDYDGRLAAAYREACP